LIRRVTDSALGCHDHSVRDSGGLVTRTVTPGPTAWLTRTRTAGPGLSVAATGRPVTPRLSRRLQRSPARSEGPATVTACHPVGQCQWPAAGHGPVGLGDPGLGALAARACCQPGSGRRRGTGRLGGLLWATVVVVPSRRHRDCDSGVSSSSTPG
jgi:hypothetical protein